MPESASPARLLLIEDDPVVVDIVRRGLDSSCFSVELAESIREGRTQFDAERFDAVVLDLGLPDGSGLELADFIRAARSDLPIVMLTAASSLDERLEGFKRGADDYLCKPFAVEELQARLMSVLRRIDRQRPHVLTYSNFELDLLERKVKRGTIEERLSARETELLAYLMRHADEVLSRSRILEEVWGADTEAESNVVSVYVNYLRNKLEGASQPRLIHAVRGVGYVLSESEPTV